MRPKAVFDPKWLHVFDSQGSCSSKTCYMSLLLLFTKTMCLWPATSELSTLELALSSTIPFFAISFGCAGSTSLTSLCVCRTFLFLF